MDCDFPGGGTRAGKPAVRAGLARLSLTLALCASAPSFGLAQGTVKEKHGSWETRCETPAGSAAEQCAVVQSVVDEERPNITLVLIALKTADRKSRLLRVMRCLPNGCVAEVFLDDKLLARMENGQTATLVIFETPEEGIGVPAQLAGFKESFEKLP